MDDKIATIIAHLHRMIAEITACNANLINIPESWMFNRESQRQHNNRVMDRYRDEIVELEELRDGHITVEQLGTARRFFNTMPAWGTYGT